MPHPRPASRTLAFGVFAVILALAGLEGVAFVALGFLEEDGGETPRDPSGWLVNAQLAFEQGFYTPDAHTLWRPTPGFREEVTPERFWGEAPLVLNEHGHRNPSMPVSKPPSSRRALLVGGSHPFGMWVPTEASYAAVLERHLGDEWSVLNAACPGHTTFQGAQYIEHYGLAFAPDVILFDLGVNDALPLALDFSRPDHEVQAVPWWSTRLRTALGRTSTYLVLKELLADATRRPVEGVRVPPENQQANVARVLELAEATGAHVLLFNQIEVGPAGVRCSPRYETLGTTFDACGVFAGYGSEANRYFVDPVHANAQGHRMLGEALYARLLELGWAE
ncbi:MAG: SGNH/GDSL hydrolase family protein [Deltaproteobacteria bacterium]|nr:SGNH/GDSL hydrolase family protein [Deltaproteobacteria bacterium]